MSSHKQHDEDDALLYEDCDGDTVIQPGQRDPLQLDVPTPTVKNQDTRATQLTPDNWNIVRRLANRSRDIVATRDRTKHLLQRSKLQAEQSLRPNWMVCRQNPPLLPGSVSFSSDFHEEWTKAAQKYEKRLLKKVIKHLPNSISALDVRLQEHKRSAQDTLQREIQDAPQRERASALFLRFTSQAEQGLHSQRPPSHLNRKR